MAISLSSAWEEFVARQVQDGRFSSAREVIEAGLSLVAQREAKLASLRATLETSATRGGANDEAAVQRRLDATAEALRAERP